MCECLWWISALILLADAFLTIPSLSNNCDRTSSDICRLPPAAVKAADAAGKAQDVFYCLKLLEATGISTVPGSGFGQAAGTFHLRTTILPMEKDLPGILDSWRGFHEKFMAEYK